MAFKRDIIFNIFSVFGIGNKVSRWVLENDLILWVWKSGQSVKRWNMLMTVGEL